MVRKGVLYVHVYEIDQESRSCKKLEIERKLSFDLSVVGGILLGLTNFIRAVDVAPGWEITDNLQRPRSRTAELLKQEENMKDLERWIAENSKTNK